MRRPVIAVVDDDRRVIESLEDLLESAGYQVRGFAAAAPLLARGFSGIDVLITDIGLPDLDGFALRDRALAARAGLPVFLITGRHELAERSRAQGITRLLCKPFDGEGLLFEIADALKQSGGRDAR